MQKYFSKIEVWLFATLRDPPTQFGKRPDFWRDFFRTRPLMVIYKHSNAYKLLYKYKSKNGNISTQVYDQPTGGGRLKYTQPGGGNTI